jgi:hypothetical protein
LPQRRCNNFNGCRNRCSGFAGSSLKRFNLVAGLRQQRQHAIRPSQMA